MISTIMAWLLLSHPIIDFENAIKNAEIIKNIELNVARIKTGKFQFIHTTRSEAGILYSRGTGTCFFDYPQQLFRMDYFEHVMENGKPKESLPTKGGQYVRTPKYILYSDIGLKDSRYTMIYHPNPVDVKLWNNNGQWMFDFRVMGFGQSREIDINQDFNDAIKVLNYLPVEFRIGSDGLVERKKHYLDQKNSYRFITSMFFDPAQGNQAVRSSLVAGKVGEPLSDLHYVNETTWQKIKDIWVPASYQSTARAQVVHEYLFTWDQVNEPMDAKLFDVEGMGEVAGNYHVVDLRAPQALLLKQRGWRPGKPKMKATSYGFVVPSDSNPNIPDIAHPAHDPANATDFDAEAFDAARQREALAKLVTHLTETKEPPKTWNWAQTIFVLAIFVALFAVLYLSYRLRYSLQKQIN